MNEILSGIKVIKLSAWEEAFEDRVSEIRKEEITCLKRAAVLLTIQVFNWLCCPTLVIIGTLLTYVFTSGHQHLDATTAFVSLSLFNILKNPLNHLPSCISELVQAHVSFRRLKDYLACEDFSRSYIEQAPEGMAISVKGGTFTWDKDSPPTLSRISLDIKAGQLVAVVGPVGSGKSSLLCSFLGEMGKLRGTVARKGSVAYVPQQAWIQNRSLKDCVLFDNPFDEKKYRRVIRACALRPDIESFPAGDATEIGEKGINLSGGQKVRVTLARAVYSDAEVYLLDDPLSAVDSRVGKHIFRKVISSSGLLKGKGTVAYVSQQAWIQNSSFRDGILFGSSFNRKRYRNVIQACALQADLDSLPAGEDTEIGEKGINLSGGQKLRVSLARAVYHDADLYLLDDPLSAVDSHVGQHIFRQVIGSTGLLKKQGNTRLMVTHGIHWLPMCDVIVVMDDGKIVWSGTYPDLTRDGLLAKYLNMSVAQDNSLKGAGVPKVKKMEDNTKDVAHNAINSTKEGQQLVLDEEFEMGKVRYLGILDNYSRPSGGSPSPSPWLILFLNNAFELAASFWLVEWTDDEYLQNTSLVNTTHYTQKTVMYVSVYAVLGILQAITTFFFVWIVFLKMLSASKRLHDDMLRSVLHQPMSFFDTNPIGRILNRFSRDMDAIDSYLADLMRIYCTNVFSVINVLFVISYTTPLFLAAAVPLIMLYYCIQVSEVKRCTSRCSRQIRRYESVSRSPVYVHFNETISGAPSIRAFGMTDRFVAKSEQLVDKNNVYTYAHISSLRWLKLRLELLGNLTTAFAALFTIMTEHLSASMAGLSVSYADPCVYLVQVTTKLNNLVQNAINVETDIVSVERIVQYIELPSEPAWVVEGHRPQADWPRDGDIRLQGYSTRYRPGLQLVLNKVTAHICSGEKIGVVGRTGAGKSSLSLSLFRLIEASEGSIVIDDINIADIGLHDLRSRLSILPQDPVLFSGTLRFNLDPLSKFSDEELWSVLEQSHLKFLWNRYPNDS
ncbi:hypothetical protein C0Q70_12580 [Pomacea canaliculata]|uniref:Uncharacterized protein n=1 Tax=Pomacea canaliculata TaxID=400727 RepID=A0A2T7P1X3_POMCA|nr:hypothetical protein C0Q70_12580 [Pomacea canaliculata]